jgi:hypothetical protein
MESRIQDATMRDLTASLSTANLNPNIPTPSGSDSDDAPLVPTPSESLGSAILDVVSDIRRMHEDAHPQATRASAQTLPAARDDDVTFESGSQSQSEERRDGSAGFMKFSKRRLWPLGHSSTSSSSSSFSKNEEKGKAHKDDDGWMALMDSVISRTNDLIASQIVVENDPDMKSRNPPLFWLLYSGHE